MLRISIPINYSIRDSYFRIYYKTKILIAFNYCFSVSPFLYRHVVFISQLFDYRRLLNRIFIICKLKVYKSEIIMFEKSLSNQANEQTKNLINIQIKAS